MGECDQICGLSEVRFGEGGECDQICGLSEVRFGRDLSVVYPKNRVFV